MSLALKIFGVVLILGTILTTVFIFNQDHKLAPQLATPTPSAEEPSATPSSKPTQKPAQSPQNSPTPSPTIKIAVGTGESKDITVEISQDALNSQIQASLNGQSLGTTPLGEATITDSNVKIESGFLTISGTAKNGFVSLPFQTKATLELQDSQPKLTLTDLTLNNIPLPQIITDQLTTVVQSKVNDLINSYNFKLKSISVESGKIILVGEK